MGKVKNKNFTRHEIEKILLSKRKILFLVIWKEIIILVVEHLNDYLVKFEYSNN